MRIDSSGRGAYRTTTEGNASADDLTIAGSDNVGITIRSGTAPRGIYFSDATSGNAEFDGFIVYDQNSRDLRFGTQQATRMRIDSGGRLLMGTTSSQTVDSADCSLQVIGSNFSNSGFTQQRFVASVSGHLLFAKSSGTIGGQTMDSKWY